MQITIDTDGVTVLADRFDGGELEADEITPLITNALAFSELESDSPGRLDRVTDDWGVAADVLRAAAEAVLGAELDLEATAAALGVSVAELRAELDAIGVDPDANADEILAALATDFVPPPESIRDLYIGLPDPGVDPALDAAIDVLERIRAGEPIDTENLSRREQEALRVIASAIGGDEVTVRVTETVIVRGAQGDDDYRRVTKDVPITDRPIGEVADFVGGRLGAANDARPTRARTAADAQDFLDRFDTLTAQGASRAEIAADLGVAEEDLDGAVAVANVAAGDGRLPETINDVAVGDVFTGAGTGASGAGSGSGSGEGGSGGGGSDLDDGESTTVADGSGGGLGGFIGLDRGSVTVGRGDDRVTIDDVDLTDPDAINRATEEANRQIDEQRAQRANAGGGTGREGGENNGITDAERREFGGPAEDFADSNGLL